MAIYHCSIKVFSRGKGDACAVEKAAYRSGEQLYNDRNGETYDYTRKRGVIQKDIFLPANAPAEYASRSVLWNAVEKSERNNNAQLARELEISLPVELTIEQNISLAHEYVKKHFVSAGMCADVCVHDKGDGNPHFHVMLTLRPFNEDGTWAAKSRKEYILDDNGERIRLPSGEYKSRKVNTIDWNEQSKAEEWREAWADTLNSALERYGFSERVDHRSYERQGIEQIPTIHMGAAACQMERKGIKTERGNINREVADINKELRQTRARIDKLRTWTNELEQSLAEQTAEPTLYEVIQAILRPNTEKPRWAARVDLKKAAEVLTFLQKSNITELSQLQGSVGEMKKKFNNISDRLKANERRKNALDKHIEQAEYYLEFKTVYNDYLRQKPKNQEAFRERNRREITLYEAADKYLKQHMNGHTFSPQILKEWKKERAKLTDEHKGIYWNYTTFKNDVQKFETVKRTVESILCEREREHALMRDKSTER